MKKEEEIRAFMDLLSSSLDAYLEEFHGMRKGFILVVFPFKEDENKVADFASNCNRASSIPALRELADVLENKNYMPPTIGSA